jgi:UPF0755 protein
VFKKIFSLLFLLILLLSTFFCWTFYQELNAKLTFENNEKLQFITVKSGSSISAFSKQLEKRGWIKSHFWLRNYGRLFPKQAVIKAGTYSLARNTSVLALLAQVVEGKEHQFSITFIEGTRFSDALVVLQNHPHIRQSLTNKTIPQIAKLIGIKEMNNNNPEGWLFPDTYAFTMGTTDIALLKQSYQKMKLQLDTLWQQRMAGLPYETPYQALIMASIIEKETSYIPEQPIISSVFVNRLNINMRLQTDPTIIYGLGERYHGDITRAHKREKTAYNTYRINGLPPTPIALAGLSAIEATLNPISSDYFYFVSQGNGQHTFSRNLKEHNLAVKDYLKLQSQK